MTLNQWHSPSHAAALKKRLSPHRVLRVTVKLGSLILSAETFTTFALLTSYRWIYSTLILQREN